MASEDVYTGKTATEESGNSGAARHNLFFVDFLLRLLLFASSVVALVVLVTSKETENVPISLQPLSFGLRDAKFQHSPAFIYLLVALCFTCLYSIITMIPSLAAANSASPSAKLLLILAAHDVLVAGVMASATGSAGAVAYLGLKGNTHVNWNKVCNFYGKFCRHIGGAFAVSLFASIILVVLVIVSSYSLYRRSH